MTTIKDELTRLKENIKIGTHEKKDDFLTAAKKAYNLLEKKFVELESSSKEGVQQRYDQAENAFTEFKNATKDQEENLKENLIDKIDALNKSLENAQKK